MVYGYGKVGLSCYVRLPQFSSLANYEGWNFNFGNAAVTFDTATPTEFIFSQILDVLPKVM